MKIVIENLEFYAIIGILKSERELAQKVIINLSIDYDFDKKFIDYAEVVKFIEKFMKNEKFYLIEDALLSLSQNLKYKYPQIKHLKLSIKKPQILQNCTVAVEFEKSF